MMPSSLINVEQLARQIKEQSVIKVLKPAVANIAKQQQQQFESGGNIAYLVHERAHAIDGILRLCWQHLQLDKENAVIIAVGGYGRNELHPHSDIDFLIVHNDPCLDSPAEPPDPECLHSKLHDFITLLWDIGLQPGHAVRTVAQCVQEARADVTVITNLIEARLITGATQLFEQLQKQISPKYIWPIQQFARAKIQEQADRYRKFNDTAYNLEPNIKESPGGLRDIQLIGWIAKRYFHVRTLKELIGYHFISQEEYEQLEQAKIFLWKVRFALHNIKKRCEDRLLFDYQRSLAGQFGYQDNEEKLAVEQFMSKYYQTVMEIERLNEILLQYFNEMIIDKAVEEHPVRLNRRFVAYKNYIATTNPNIFALYPFALLEIFLILAQNPQLKGIRASTIRQIRQYKYLIDDTFRKDLRCRSIFMELLRQKQGITTQFRRMNRYGVLAAYIPAFEKIVGQMQHDLYHAYTVDEHTLKVLRNVRRLSVDKFAHELPLAHQIFATLPKPELLYLAALFHDIGKGRGGNHSVLGARDAELFCQLHELSSRDIRLVTWLVKMHLEMSSTAQRKDIGDPKVIHDFAMQMHDAVHLDYLYLLTVADIRGTSPTVWNSWKDSLLIELYNLTRHALNKGLDHPIEQQEKIKQTRQAAGQILQSHHIIARQYTSLWDKLPKDYFLQQHAEDIAWHSEQIIRYQSDTDRQHDPMVISHYLAQKGSTEVLIFMSQKPHIFTIVASHIAQMRMNIIEANTYRMQDSCILHTYHILDDNEQAITEPEALQAISKRLQQALSAPDFKLDHKKIMLPRALKQFSIPTQIEFSEDFENNMTIMHLTANNRPFLLSKIGHIFIQHKIHLINARISTFGEKVEDVFYISNPDNSLITDFEQLTHLKQAIIDVLDEKP